MSVGLESGRRWIAYGRYRAGRLVRLLGTYGASDGRRRPQKGAFAAGISASWQVSSLAAEVLADWPQSFHVYLEGLVARDAGGARPGSLHRAFGGFYFALYRAFGAAEFSPVRDAFECYVAEHWTGALGQLRARSTVLTAEPTSCEYGGWSAAATPTAMSAWAPSADSM